MATIGARVFGALASVGAFFIFKLPTGLRERKKDNMKQIKSNYGGFYNIYKILPLINMVIIFIGGFVMSIVDRYGNILGVREEWASILWILIGSFGGIIIAFFTGVAISPVIVQVDTTVDILAALEYSNSKSNHTPNSSKDVGNYDLPEL